jgi:gas vesicle protein
MLRHTRTAIKWLVYGLIIGLLFAPASGKETRKEIFKWASESAGDAMKAVTGDKG